MTDTKKHNKYTCRDLHRVMCTMKIKQGEGKVLL